MAALTGQFADLLTDGFHHIIDETMYNRWDPVYTQIFRQLDSSKPDENISEVTGFGLMPVRTEHAAVTFDDPLQAFDTTFTHVEYAMAVEISEILIEDDQYSKIQLMPAQLAQSAIETIEVVHANHFNNGFNSSFTGGDGVELYSRVHPLVGGGNLANEPSSHGDLSSTTYEQALIDIAAWTDHRGKKLRFRPQKLIVPTEVLWDARKLFGSEKVPENANNAINPANSTALEVVENPYLTDVDAWFITCQNHGLDTFWRRRPRNGRDNDFATGAMRHKLDFRFSSGWESPFGTYGNQGA